MRSSSGQHFEALDHVRALAALMVVTWHFTHGQVGDPVPFNTASWLGFLDEGHSGVALFMTLSGYLFVKLLDGRRVAWGAFLWNRFVRLAPLLTLVVVLVGIRISPHDLGGFLAAMSWGLVGPVLPNGGWSITVELHFYLMLPLILVAAKDSRWSLPIFIAAAFASRTALFAMNQDVQQFAYWTIVGRIDQFLFGILCFHHRAAIGGRTALAALVGLCGFYAWFDAAGGFHGPLSTGAAWVFIPTIEGLGFGILIARYDARPFRSTLPGMRFVRMAGEYSYSIYLLHGFFVFAAASFVHEHVMNISSFHTALPWALLFFAGMVAIGRLSFRCVEKPFLRYRRSYLLPDEPEPVFANRNARRRSF